MLNLDFSSFTPIETERLLLRRISMQDAPDLFLIRSNPEALRYIGKPVASSVNEAIAWGITLKNEGVIIGSIGYHRIEKAHYRAEIGYMLNPAHWNKGITGEAAKAILEFGFEHMNLHSVEAKINPENLHSANLLKKHNFCKEAYFRENFFFNDQFQDTEVYSLLRSSWKLKQPSSF